MNVLCSRCKKEFNQTYIKTYTVKSNEVCGKCLTDDELDDLVKELDEFWKKKP